MSVSRMLARNLFPSPSPVEAPFTNPAMSTNSTTAGMILSVPEILAKVAKRLSGTATTPTVGSMVANG